MVRCGDGTLDENLTKIENSVVRTNPATEFLVRFGNHQLGWWRYPGGVII